MKMVINQMTLPRNVANNLTNFRPKRVMTCCVSAGGGEDGEGRGRRGGAERG
jgi:hypothetical protein